MPTSPKFTNPPPGKGDSFPGVVSAESGVVEEFLDAPDPVEPSEDTILIHILEDGFTAHGRTWYRGQELEYVVGQGPYNDTLDKHGESWLDRDDAKQMRAYGRVMFRNGPWPGRPYPDAKAAEEESKRARQPPSLSATTSRR